MARVLFWVLELVQATDHVVVEHIVVPYTDKDGTEGEKQALHTANVRDIVHKCVPCALILNCVQVHLDCEIKLGVVVLLVGPIRHSNKRK